jgi:antitoxin VapB
MIDSAPQTVPGPADIRLKEDRARAFLERHGLDALVLGRQDNFAWFTNGGDNRVVTTSEMGVGWLVVTRDAKRLICHSMDAFRLLDEQTPWQNLEPVVLRWHEGSMENAAVDLTRGMRICADFPLPGARLFGREIVDLHYPLTDLEIERCRWIGHESNRILVDAAYGLRTGDTERDIAARLLYEYARAGMTIDVLIVGTDERISRYRHPMPTGKPLDRYALLHPAARRWGLHANVSRLVHFGEPPPGLQATIDAVRRVGARVHRMIAPGIRFCDVLDEQKRLYAALGYADEWNLHFQGGITGYTLADPGRCLDARETMRENQAYDYFITITGAKFEELTLLTPTGAEIASLGAGWPVSEVESEGEGVLLPDVLIR